MGHDDPIFVGQNRRLIRCREPSPALQALHHGLGLVGADAQGLAALAMAVASGLTPPEDILALFAAFLLLLHRLIIVCPFNRFKRGFPPRLTGLSLEQIVVGVTPFNSPALTA